MTEITNLQQRPAHLWKPGTSGNPAGRPRGSRNKLSDDFVAALYDDFQDHGPAAIAACRAAKPDVYLCVIAGLLPRDVSIKVQQLDDLNDDQLLRKLAVLTEMTKPLLSKLNHRKRVTDLPAPRAILLSACNFDLVQRHVCGRGNRPAGVHQREVASLNDLFDAVIKSGFGGSKRSEFVPKSFHALFLFARLIQKHHFVVVKRQQRVKIALTHELPKQVTGFRRTIGGNSQSPQQQR